tara:strand:- start:124 stop:465 length:342 start_codon:yes stop_codon:yes gene_type:complete
MIDTDKYEGHTEGPWVALNDNAVKTPKHDDPYAFIERRNDDGYVVALSKADAQLIADAPLLLAEVKRLREESKKKGNVLTTLDEMIRNEATHAELMKALEQGLGIPETWQDLI